MKHFSNRQWLYIALVLVLLAIGGVFSYWLYSTRTQVDLTTFLTATLSVLISMVALVIALQTYLSIDSVNNITKMDGNILDNENYVTSIPEFVDEYAEETESALCAALFGKIRSNLKYHSGTALDFADTLQSMIDILVLFPALDLRNQMKDRRIARDIEWVMRRVRERADELHSISKGSSIQIREAVKLFMAVYEYQQAVENKGALGSTGLLQVRAAMIRNPVSATVYHNYLGLYYRKSAVQIFDKQDRTSVSAIAEWGKARAAMSDGDLEKLKRYLANARAAFARALALSVEDPMWRGYVLFNQARVSFIERAFLRDIAADPLKEMRDAIDARTTLNELIAEVSGDRPGTSVLHQHYLYQEEYARQLYAIYCLALEETATYRGLKVVDAEALRAASAPYLDRLQQKSRESLARLYTS